MKKAWPIFEKAVKIEAPVVVPFKNRISKKAKNS